MKHLNKAATEIFSRLLTRMNGSTFAFFPSQLNGDLIVSVYYYSIGTPMGTGKLYSIAHYRESPEGGFAEPEMLLIVVDRRTELNDPQALYITPQHYEKSSTGIDQTSTELVNDAVFAHDEPLLDQHINIAQEWLARLDTEKRWD